jgi:hypothetical protein
MHITYDIVYSTPHTLYIAYMIYPYRSLNPGECDDRVLESERVDGMIVFGDELVEIETLSSTRGTTDSE